jgi:hypothetical protein
LLSKTAALFTSSSSTPQHWPSFWRSQEEVQAKSKASFWAPNSQHPQKRTQNPAPPPPQDRSLKIPIVKNLL